MRVSRCVAGAVVLVVISGFSSLTGSWTADDSGDSKSPIANVSFCEDGTFTAGADYGGGKLRVMSGHYTTTHDGQLKLESDGNRRTYTFAVVDDTLTIGKGEKPAKMKRLKPRSRW